MSFNGAHISGAMEKTADARRGRPPLADEVMKDRVNIRVPADVMEAIRRVRAKRKDGADAAQVIREGLVYWLESIGEI